VGEMAERLASWMSEFPPLVDSPGEFEDEPRTGGDVVAKELSEFTCPECGGTLWLDHSYESERFRCRVGHTFSPRGLLAGKQEALEAALWGAVVALEERADVSRRLLRRLEASGRPSQLKRYRDDIEQTAGRADTLRGLISELVKQGMLAKDGEHDGIEPAS